jgi:hypothetical protein
MLQKTPLELVIVRGICHTGNMEKVKGPYFVVTGEAYYVKADSEEEAEAIFNVGMGYLDEASYPEFDTADAFNRIEYADTYTTYEPITDFSV